MRCNLTIGKQRVCIVVTEPYVNIMDDLISAGVYVSRQEIIKDALRYLLAHYEIPLIKKKISNKDSARSI